MAEKRAHRLGVAEILTRSVPKIVREEIVPLRPMLGGVRDAVVVDVGANAGAWTKAWLQEFGDCTERVLLFEPQPGARIHADGAALFTQAERAKLELLALALSSCSGRTHLWSDEPGSALASLYPASASGWGLALQTPIDVSRVSLDDFMRSRGIPRVDLVKIDTEGAELDILHGARASLAAGAISALLFEFGSPHVHSRVFFLDIFSLLTSLGYELFLLDPERSFQLKAIPHYDYALERFDRVAMFFAALSSAMPRFAPASPDI